MTAQIPTGTTRDDHRWSVEQSVDAVRRGATHVILGMPPSRGAAGVDEVAGRIAEPLRQAIG
jgi:hypothetical protein